MSKVTEVEIRFNAKSKSQNIEDALEIATKHGADQSGNTCTVCFTDAANRNIQKLLTLVVGLKGAGEWAGV